MRRNSKPDPGLGPLESAVMAELWALPTATVRDVYERLRPTRDIAYTTIMTTMDRLYRKSLLTRQMEGNTYRYRSRVDRRGWVRSWAKGAIDTLLPSLDSAGIAYFVEEAKKTNPQLLKELRQRIEDLKK